MLLISLALALVEVPSGLQRLVFSLVSNALASFHRFVILHEFYNGNWNAGILGPAGLPRD